MFKPAVERYQPHENLARKHDAIENKPLRPSQSSLLNSLPASQQSFTTLKRKAVDMSPDTGKNHTVQAYAAQRQSALKDLHVNVVFDENDFDDDNDVNLDEDEPTKTPQVPKTRIITASQLTSMQGMHPPQTPASSATIPWSSSPLDHLQRPPQGQPLPAPKAADVEEPKRRFLPWQADAEDKQDEAARPDAKPKAKPAKKKKEKVQETPQSKTDSPMPWNKTMSALKRENKKIRKGQQDGEQGAKPRNVAKSVARVFLSEEQKSILKLVVDRQKSVFFTGSAGTGKSVLLRDIIKELKQKYRTQPDRVAVTASTGLAACNIQGVTLHSFAGIGLGKESVADLVKKIKRNAKAKQRWLRTKVLIIDEISMVDGDLFDKLEGVARTIRGNGRPFGGIQIVITGDFFQLPPVPDVGRVAKFAFDAGTWNTSIEHTIGLTQIFRQRDPVFADMLNEMRLGRLSNDSIKAFRSLSRPLSKDDNFEATELFPTRAEVEYANRTRMKGLMGQEFAFEAQDGGAIQDPAARDKLLSHIMAPKTITLKKGAQVMLIKNTDDVLVNGSVGRVLAFMDEKGYNYYRENEHEFWDMNGKEGGVHAMSDLARKFENKSNTNANTSKVWPLVRFVLPDGTFRELLCQNETWTIEQPNGEVSASRAQLPLILAWALSIHKAQGQTLERVRVDLGKAFEKGQAYVALSRATSQEGLQVTGFDPAKVQAHEKVRRFYDGLYSVRQATAVAVAPTAHGMPGPDVVEDFDEDEELFVTQ